MFTPCLPRKTRALTDRCRWCKGKHNRFRAINQDFIASATEERCSGLAVKHAGWMFLKRLWLHSLCPLEAVYHPWKVVWWRLCLVCLVKLIGQTHHASFHPNSQDYDVDNWTWYTEQSGHRVYTYVTKRQPSTKITLFFITWHCQLMWFERVAANSYSFMAESTKHNI